MYSSMYNILVIGVSITMEQHNKKSNFSYGSKTKTIKKRSIYVYLPGPDMVSKWKALAKKADSSISKFVIEHVENSLSQETQKEGHASRSELLDELRRLNEENKDLHKRTKMLDTVVDRLEEELRTYRAKPFIEEDSQHTRFRKYEPRLIDEFRKRKEIKKVELRDVLGLKQSENAVVNAMLKEIENLERKKLVIDCGGKWRWNG